MGDRTPKTEPLYLAPPEVLRLFSCLSEPCRTLVLVAVLTGMRIGEILALRWKNLDLLRGIIQVRESMTERHFGAPKTKSSKRNVPMSGPLRQALEQQRARCRQTEPDDLVFGTSKHTPLNPKNLLRRVLRSACVKLELPLISWHSFRHTHATLLGEVGESLRTTSAILGHSNLGTTMIYAHAIPESQRRAVDKVAEILFPSVPKFSAPTENGKANRLMSRDLMSWSRRWELNPRPSDYSIYISLLVLNVFSLISRRNVARYSAAIVPKLFPSFGVSPFRGTNR